MASFVLGVTSSMLATFIIGIGVWWGRYHLPGWLAGRIRSSSVCAGQWKVSTAADPSKITGRVAIRQFGSSVYGSVTSEESRGGVSRHRDFKLQGTVTGLQVCVTYWDIRTGVRGVVALKVSTNGDRMDGRVSYFNMDSGEWTHGPVFFYRDAS